jgi:glycine dehydrogenase subunit 1
MSFVAHTPEEIEEMLATIGSKTIEDLFVEIPSELQINELPGFGAALTEMQVAQLLQQRVKQDTYKLNFIGAGAYEHYIPAAVWEIATRGEFLTAYTPYQAEASQGTLQLLYEFQTMFANLTGLDVSNASLYDGATALAEAILMALRCDRKSEDKAILIPKSVHPYYRDVVTTVLAPHNIQIRTIDYDPSSGQVATQQLQGIQEGSFAALVVPQPNFFGILEDVDYLTNWAHQNKALVIALSNPMSLALLKAPGAWGDAGADIACGEAQPFGVPLASGGPYIGYLCCKKEYIRQLPGRLVGVTTDLDGNRGFTLTLQAREQHIKRAKATSNICTNQSLLATVVTIYLSLLGATGLRQVAAACHTNTLQLKNKIISETDLKVLFNAPFFHEIVIQTPQPAVVILDKLASLGIQAGFDLKDYYSELGDAILCCVTETKTSEDIDNFVQALQAC